MKYLHTDKAPAAIGPYSQAVQVGSLLFCSGQIPLCPLRMELVPGEIAEQTTQVFDNIEAVLTEAGIDLQKVVKTTVFLTDMGDFPVVNKIYAERFCQHKPARSTVEVANLPKGAGIEIEVIASLD